MTNREAIDILEDLKVDVGLSGSFLFEGRAGEIISEALDLSIQALEKQEPKKPIRSMDDYGRVYECPICGEHYLELYCPTCGQAIDWD